ncbi:hypothetical protein NL676_016800 [Syzygium grande]|nr:hypothetical protein NL676_016800 [Syzygium grande]
MSVASAPLLSLADEIAASAPNSQRGRKGPIAVLSGLQKSCGTGSPQHRALCRDVIAAQQTIPTFTCGSDGYGFVSGTPPRALVRVGVVRTTDGRDPPLSFALF